MTIASAAMLAAIIIFVCAMMYVAVNDLLRMTIINTLCLLLCGAYFVLAPLAGFRLEMIGISIASALTVLFFSVAFFAMGWIGGGDGKLATVTALWVGADQTVPYVTYAALFGGVLTVALIAFRRFEVPMTWHDRAWIARLHSRESGVPYGVALALAGLVVLGDTVWVTGLS
jgi:prepilin peptidase CpaA